MSGPSIIALDLARRFGWCEGPHSKPSYGHGIFGETETASHEYVFRACMKWCYVHFVGQARVVYEAPLPPAFVRGKTNMNTSRITLGLAAIVEAVACDLGVPVFEADVADVRQHFIQTRKLKSKEAKQAVFDRCVMLGLEPTTTDCSDAIAVWDYQWTLLDRATLFNRDLARQQ